MAVLARAPDHAWTLSSPLQRTGSRLPVPVERAAMTYREVVALLAKVGTRPHEQLVMVGTMRLVTVDATLADRRVFPEERPPLFGVAGVADVVDGIGVQQGTGRRAVRVVAVDAGHLALWKRHVRTLAELRTLLLVTLEAGLGDALPGLKAGVRDLLHGIVAVGAAEIALLVPRSRPVHASATLVAGQALGILDVHGSAPAPGEPDQRGLVERVPGVVRPRSVAGFAALPLTIALRIQAEDLRMQRLAEMLVLLAVAFDAPRLADVLGRLRGRVHDNLHGLLRGRLNGRLLGNLDGHGLDPTHGQRHDGQTDWPHSRLRSDRPHALLS